MRIIITFFIPIIFFIGCSNPNQTVPPSKTETNKVFLKLDTKGHTSNIQDIITTKSGDIISASTDKTIRVYDFNGTEKRKILGQIGNGGEGEIFAIALSKDEKYLAVGGFMHKGKGKDYNRVGDIRIYNYQTGKLLKVLTSHTDTVVGLAFSNDKDKSNYLISGSSDNSSKIWKVDHSGSGDFKLKDTIRFHSSQVYAVKIIKNGEKYFAITAGLDNQIALYDMSIQQIINSNNLNDKLLYLAINSNYQHIAVCGLTKKEINIFDYSLNHIKTIKSKTKPSGLAYDEKGKYLLVGSSSDPDYSNIYNVSKDYSIKSIFKKHKNLTMAVSFIQKDNKLFAVTGGGDNFEIYIWDIDTLEVKTKIIGVGQSIRRVGIKGDYIAWGNAQIKKIGQHLFEKYIDLNTFEIYDIKNYPRKFHRMSKKNGSYTLSHAKGGEYGYRTAILEVRKDNIVQNEIIKKSTDGHRHNYYGWYKDYIISCGMNGLLKVYNKKGIEVASLIGHSSDIWSLAVHGDRLVSGGADQTIKVWNLKELKNKNSYQEIFPQITLFISKENEYIAYTNEGFFKSSKNGAQYIGYYINQGANKEASYITVENLYNTFYKPDLIQKSLNGEKLDKYSKDLDIYKLLKEKIN